jgi:single-stranded-DNA-specific exonuclease
VVPAPQSSNVAALQDALLLPEAVCHLLAARGHGEPESAKRFLRPRLDMLAPADTLHDLPRAVSRLAEAIRAGETIFVHGDYDVDGMASTALLTRGVARAWCREGGAFCSQSTHRWL